MYEFEFELTEKDLEYMIKEFNEAEKLYFSFIKLFNIFVSFSIICVIINILFYFYFQIIKDPFFMLFRIAMIIISIICLLIVKQNLFVYSLTAKLSYKKLKHILLRKMQFNDDEFSIITGENGEIKSIIPWKSIINAKNLEHTILFSKTISWKSIIYAKNLKHTISLLQIELNPIIIPKRIFTNEEEVNKFFEFAKNNIAKNS